MPGWRDRGRITETMEQDGRIKAAREGEPRINSVVRHAANKGTVPARLQGGGPTISAAINLTDCHCCGNFGRSGGI